MMGHGREDPKQYSRQCIHDNVSKCSVERLTQINAWIVKLGHRTIGKTGGTMKCRSDSKVVTTNVHDPTDLSLLWDSACFAYAWVGPSILNLQAGARTRVY